MNQLLVTTSVTQLRNLVVQNSGVRGTRRQEGINLLLRLLNAQAHQLPGAAVVVREVVDFLALNLAQDIPLFSFENFFFK